MNFENNDMMDRKIFDQVDSNIIYDGPRVANQKINGSMEWNDDNVTDGKIG